MIQVWFTGILKTSETKTSAAGKEFTTGVIETTRKAKDETITSRWEVKCFGNAATFIKNAAENTSVICQGELEMNSWEYQGKAYSKPQITVKWIGSTANGYQDRGTTQQKTSFNTQGRAATYTAPLQDYNHTDDDLPF